MNQNVITTDGLSLSVNPDSPNEAEFLMVQFLINYVCEMC